MIRTLVAAALLSFTTGPAIARSAGRREAHKAFESLYRSMLSFRKADRTLNLDFSRLNSKLSPARRQALKADELAWLRRRDQECDRHKKDGSRFELACAIRVTNTHARFLEDRYRRCVKSRCSDLNFYNTQDAVSRDLGPKLVGYTAISKYHGPDAGFIAVYTHDANKALYPVGADIFVTGFIRLRGRYEGRVFQPKGYEAQDISAGPDFKKLTKALFPGRRGGTWAGGDTGGFVEN